MKRILIGCLALFCVDVGFAQRRPANAPVRPSSGTVTVFSSPIWQPSSVNELVDRADIIVEGVVAETLPTRLWNPNDPSSHCSNALVNVTRTVKGAPGKKIAVYQNGGRIGELNFVDANDTIMEVGQRYILFLKKDDGRVQGNEGLYYQLGVWNGKFKVDEDGRLKTSASMTPALKKHDREQLEQFMGLVGERVRATAK